MGYIYKITNKINQKVYIGLTCRSVEQRWLEHLKNVNNLKEKRPLYSAIAKYGEESFLIETIEEVEDDFLGEREIYWINFYNSYYNGYNATLGGDGVFTRQIMQYDMKGNLIAEYDNIQQAIKNTQISESVIRGVCQKRYKTAKNYIFKYKDDKTEINTLISEALKNKHYKIQVYQYDLSGKLIHIWNSVKEANINSGITNISRALNQSKPCGNYIWRTFDKDFYDNLDLNSIIIQLSKDNKILNYYSSFLEAAKALGKNQGNVISRACKNNKMAYGYKWKYLKDLYEMEEEFNEKERN